MLRFLRLGASFREQKIQTTGNFVFLKILETAMNFCSGDWVPVKHKETDPTLAIYFPSDFQRHWYRRAEIQWVFLCERSVSEQNSIPMNYEAG